MTLMGNLLGDDVRGKNIRAYLNKLNILAILETNAYHTTPIALCLVEEKTRQRRFILDHKSTQDVSTYYQAQIEEHLITNKYDIIFIQPYLHQLSHFVLKLLPTTSWIMAQDLDSHSEFLPQIDALQISLAEENALRTPEEVQEYLHSFWKGKLKDIFITMGAQGVWWMSLHQKPLFLKSIPARKIINTTGCGDAFRAGLMLGLCKNKDMQTSLQIGQRFGSHKAEVLGSHFLMTENERFFSA